MSFKSSNPDHVVAHNGASCISLYAEELARVIRASGFEKDQVIWQLLNNIEESLGEVKSALQRDPPTHEKRNDNHG